MSVPLSEGRRPEVTTWSCPYPRQPEVTTWSCPYPRQEFRGRWGDDLGGGGLTAKRIVPELEMD
jgi:hypothetical protein